MTGGDTGRGRLRVSDADREQVIDILKTAFVQGRLTQDELSTRAGQALASWTFAELSAITADIPAGRIAAPPLPQPIRASTKAPGNRRAVVWAACAMMALPLMGAAFLTFDGGFIVVFLLVILAMAVVTAEPVSR